VDVTANGEWNYRDWHVENLGNSNYSSEVISISEPLKTDINHYQASVVMDSPWPMQGHDLFHTCHSPYNTENTTGTEIWRVRGDRDSDIEGSAVVDANDTVYFGTLGSDSSLYALYPNGTRKWRFAADGLIWCTPALANDGVIYFTTWGNLNNLQAVYPNGTNKWTFYQLDSSASSPAISPDGTIYFGTDGGNIFAIYPNGTKKWRYSTGYIVMGSPAIGGDGTIYIGSMDQYLYAINSNGTLRWRFNTGSWIKGDVSIANDGTIYVPSFNGYFYALAPNGTLKWKASTGGSIAAAGVALAEDGTIYVGTEVLRAYVPNGTLLWATDVGGQVYGTVPAVSADGTIYVAAGTSLVAVNPDGTEQWRRALATQWMHGPPSIGRDGTVYVGSSSGNYGYLHAFGVGPLKAEAGGPYTGALTIPVQFSGRGFGGTPPYEYYWDFGDSNISTEQNPAYTYAARGNYTAILTVTDVEDNQSSDTTSVTIGYPPPQLQVVRPERAFYFFNIKLFPLPGRVFAIGPITFVVNASQVDADIDRVEFKYEGELMATDTEPPYTYVHRVHQPIGQDVWIYVYDTAGNKNSRLFTIFKLW